MEKLGLINLPFGFISCRLGSTCACFQMLLSGFLIPFLFTVD